MPAEHELTHRAYLVKSSSFALGVLHHSVSNIFVVYPISKCDSDGGSYSNGMSLRVWIVVCEIASHVHDGSAPAVETEDFIG